MKSISFHSKLILFTLALLALPMSCKDDDSKPDDGETTETVEVYQSQVVTIELPSDVELDEYEAKLGDITLPVVKFNENTIAFQVPSSYTPGEAEFKLPDLDLDIHYDIKETTLTQSAGETLAPFINEINQVSDEIAEEDTEEAEYLRNVITEFNGYYESLPEADKLTMAKYYKVNSELFNDILHPDLNGESGRINEIMDIADKYDVHVIAFGTGVALLLLAPDPAEKTAGALLSILAWKYSRGGLRELMAAGLDTVKVGFGSVWSNKNEDTTDEAISFTSGEPYTAALNMQRRNATTANQNSGTEGFTNFFYSLDILSTAVDKLNGVIQFVNDYVFFANISLVPVFTMPSENPLMTEPAEADSYGALQFSVADSGVEIGNISFQDGEINITLNVLNGEDFIETTLNYTYDDYFSHFSGSFPIEITSACANSNLEVTATANGNTATATASGGVSPYTYSWSNGATGATITGLEPGIYVVTATDANGCTAIASVMIEDNCANSDLAVSATANGSSATAMATGGVPPYTYSWSNGATGANVSGLSPGIYTVTVADAYGCTASASVEIEPVNPCDNAPAPIITLIESSCTYGDGSPSYFLNTTFSYYDPEGRPLQDSWIPVDGTAYAYDYPTLISGTPDNGVYKTFSYGQICCCENEVATIFVRNTCGIESNVLTIDLNY